MDREDQAKWRAELEDAVRREFAERMPSGLASRIDRRSTGTISGHEIVVGPYDEETKRVAPYAVDITTPTRMRIDHAANIVGASLARDFNRWFERSISGTARRFFAPPEIMFQWPKQEEPIFITWVARLWRREAAWSPALRRM